MDYFDNQEKLTEYLDEINPYIGHIIIEFNCLEDEITALLCEIYGKNNEEKIYVILSSMMFRKKATTLFKLYNIDNKKYSHNFESELRELDATVTLCGKNRNQYAHGSWLHASPIDGVSVKVTANKNGVEKIYRKFDKESMLKDLNLITSTRAHLNHLHKRFMEKKC